MAETPSEQIMNWDLTSYFPEFNGPDMAQFKEALQKGLRGLEIDRHGLGADGKENVDVRTLTEENKTTVIDDLKSQISRATPDRIFQVKTALHLGVSIDEVYQITGIDPWFLHNIKDIINIDTVFKFI